jgi:CRISPR-associated protein Csm4
MAMWIAKMKFTRAVRFGIEGIGLESAEEICRSDTLFSAIIHAWSDLFGEKETDKLLSEFESGNPPFIIGSAFVFDGETLYVPRPQIPPAAFDDPDLAEAKAKEINRCSYVTLPIFKAWIKGEPLKVDEVSQCGSDYAGCFSKQIVPHVALDRITSASQIYHAAHVVFGKNCGLWTLIEVEDDGVRSRLNAALRLLGEKGLGGDRSLGLGGFLLEGGEMKPASRYLTEIFEMSDPDGFLTLSLFHPADTELEAINESARYSLVRRKGWISSPAGTANLKRQTVSMFAEGSVFHREFRGHLVDVTPQAWRDMNLHTIYRNGLAFMAPVRIPEAT